MKNNILVSVVVPMYNAQKYVKETIDSVLEQTYNNFEIIIVDNCSTDKSREIVNSYNNDRIKLIELKVNSGGPAQPRNVGIENAKGEYIAFLDSDDVWLVEKLEKQINFMNKHKVNFVSCDCSLIDESSRGVSLSKRSQIFNEITSKKNISDVIKNSFILTSSVLIKKDLLFKFNEEEKYMSVEDYDMWLKVLVEQQSKFKYLNQKLIKYRIVENSASGRGNVLKQELKANVVLANFILKNPKYIWAYFYRIFFHLLRKKLKEL